jgi:hypothetical protein
MKLAFDGNVCSSRLGFLDIDSSISFLELRLKIRPDLLCNIEQSSADKG